jgi:hypothetical protein
LAALVSLGKAELRLPFLLLFGFVGLAAVILKPDREPWWSCCRGVEPPV